MAGIGIKVLAKLKEKKGGETLEYEWGSTKVLQDLNLESLTRVALRNHLDARDLDITGTKKAMIKRLQGDLEAERLRSVAYAEQLEAEFEINRDMEERGSAYGVGSNHAGQLGVGDTEPRDVFTVIPKTRGLGVVTVSANNDTCFAITADHEVLVWGGYGAGATGMPQTDEDADHTEPQFVHDLNGEEIRTICIGASHAAAATSGGDVFAWGHNQCGQLGVADFRKRPTPELLSFFEQDPSLSVHVAAAGENHTAALTAEGRVYCWGHVDAGKLGIGVDERYGAREEERFFFPAPTLVSKLAQYRVREVACGAAHTLARTSSGRVFAWGHGAGGRLGLGDCNDRIEPAPILDLDNKCVRQIAAGTWNSAAIVSYPPLKNTGWVYTWGSGYHGQLAHGTTQVLLKPSAVKSLMRRQLSARSIELGSHHCAIIAVDGELYTWGSNANGCLGHRIREHFVQYTPEPGHVSGFGAIVERVGRGMVRAYALGREFTVVATSPYEGPSEEVATRLMDEERLRSDLEKLEEEQEHQLERRTSQEEAPNPNSAAPALPSSTALIDADPQNAPGDAVSKILDKGMRSAKSKLVA
ncbi:hypothetical protein CTAYLR_009776 [Chrysophaeum taylorii]|uniref:SAP domain-containing protein n=1 Tax=Chrysophaeum taylorii TaxID=2483200 RepID=A0AAD7UF22_9STRA|nr:hypothetical protein CTAYLR_009776 [Chrysophaeum taylorii]